VTRAERLLDLITTLLSAREALPFAALREHFEDYQGDSYEAAIRKFERDKAELLELGVPLEYEEPSEESEGGYLLSKDSYFLPALELSPGQLTLLGVAGSAAASMEGFPWGDEVARALEKISMSLGASRESLSAQIPSARLSVHSRPRGDPSRVSGHFLALQDAIARRKQVSLEYEGLYRGERSQRTVDPLGLFLREAAWNLQAYCHLRKAPRSFLLDRIVKLKVNDKQPKSPDFDPKGSEFAPKTLKTEGGAKFAPKEQAGEALRTLSRLKPWDYPVHPEEEVKLWLSARLAPLAQSLFGEGLRLEPQAAGGGARVILRVRYREALLERIMTLPGGVRIEAPKELAGEHQRRLRAGLEALGAGMAGEESGQ